MHWNTLQQGERLRLWKTLRNNLEGKELRDQVQLVASFFDNIQYSARIIDYFDPTYWPTPWEIIYNDNICKSSVSLLIYYTFSLLSTPVISELSVINDGSDIYLLPVINAQYVLNYEQGVVNNYSYISTIIAVIQQIDNKQIKKIA